MGQPQAARPGALVYERHVALAHDLHQVEHLALAGDVHDLGARSAHVHAGDLDEVPQVVVRPEQLRAAPAQVLADVGGRQQPLGRLPRGRAGAG